MGHHLRYITSLTILTIIPEAYFLSFLSLQELLLCLLISVLGVVFMVSADMGFTKGDKTDSKKWVWDFNDESVIGIKIKNLPIEEFLFPLVWIPLPIAVWEYIKDVEFQNVDLALILMSCLLILWIVFPRLMKADK